MQIINMKMPATKRVVPVSVKRESKYDFAALVPGSDQCISVTGLATADDAVKASTRLSSAAAQYRKRSGSKAEFAVRKGVDESTGLFWAAVWKTSSGLDGDGTTSVAEGVETAAAPADAQVDPGVSVEGDVA